MKKAVMKPGAAPGREIPEFMKRGVDISDVDIS